MASTMGFVMDLTLLTYIHAGLSIVALAAGFPVAMGLLRSGVTNFWTVVFLVASVETRARVIAFARSALKEEPGGPHNPTGETRQSAATKSQTGAAAPWQAQLPVTLSETIPGPVDLPPSRP